jgi:hypothetical protein
VSNIQELTTEMSVTIKDLESNLVKWAPDQISTATMRLAILNITLGVRVAELESEALQLKTAREIEEASAFLKMRETGSSVADAERQIKLDTQEIKGNELKADAQAKKIKAIVYHTSSLISTAQSHLKAVLSDRINIMTCGIRKDK